jgi:hypothetical protein
MGLDFNAHQIGYGFGFQSLLAWIWEFFLSFQIVFPRTISAAPRWVRSKCAKWKGSKFNQLGLLLNAVSNVLSTLENCHSDPSSSPITSEHWLSIVAELLLLLLLLRSELQLLRSEA